MRDNAVLQSRNQSIYWLAQAQTALWWEGMNSGLLPTRQLLSPRSSLACLNDFRVQEARKGTVINMRGFTNLLAFFPDLVDESLIEE